MQAYICIHIYLCVLYIFLCFYLNFNFLKTSSERGQGHKYLEILGSYHVTDGLQEQA